MARMKTEIFAAIVGLAVLAAGCVSTVDNRRAAGVPFGKDTIQARYERPMDQVYQAAKDVIQFNGALVRETTLQNQTNTVNGIAKIAEGKISQNTVWVRVEQADPRVTAVTVQARTKGGGTDIELASEMDKQIALKLVR
jgi:hypothetical protein